jgi:hypothetical protein
MTKQLFYDAERWRDRAEDARRVAMEIPDPVSRRQMLEIAESYEGLARRATGRQHEAWCGSPERTGPWRASVESP